MTVAALPLVVASAAPCRPAVAADHRADRRRGCRLVCPAADGIRRHPLGHLGRPADKDRIIADIDHVHANGGGVYMINNSRGVQPEYLSPEYMDLVKTVVQECKKNGMKVWIEGDCGYPDGFAGGLISQDYPQLGMQGIVSDAHCTVAAGQTLDIPLPRHAGHSGHSAGGAAPAADAPASAGHDPCHCLPTASSNIRCRVAAAESSLLSCPAAEVRYNL